MAAGDNSIFDEALNLEYYAGWALTDDIKVALVTNAVVPATTDTTPALGDYTEVTAGGNYTAGGVSIGNWGAVNSLVSSEGIIDSGTNPTWAQHASNPTNAYYAIIYNDTQTGDPAIGFIDLAGPKDMTTGPLTITWNASGIYKFRRAV